MFSPLEQFYLKPIIFYFYFHDYPIAEFYLVFCWIFLYIKQFLLIISYLFSTDIASANFIKLSWDFYNTFFFYLIDILCFTFTDQLKINFFDFFVCINFFFKFSHFFLISTSFIVYDSTDYTLFSILFPLILVLIFIFFFGFLLSFFFKLFSFSLVYFFISLFSDFIFELLDQQLNLGIFSYRYFFMFFIMFFGIFFFNFLSILPYGIALTSNLIIVLYMSISICLGLFFFGCFLYNQDFFRIFFPECPLILLPTLVLIEIFSYIIRTFSLAIRLVANIMAGHTLFFIVSNFFFFIVQLNFLFALFIFIILIFILILELGVAFLQAYVFSILILIYFRDCFYISH